MINAAENRNGAFYTGEYRNVFKEFGYSQEKIKDKIEDTWNKLFYGDEDTKIYYPVGEKEGYILDTGNVDVRSEGMSYGMMICVQMNKKQEFDRLWTWAKRYMQHDSGEYKSYFAWSLNTDGTRKAQGPAPDGEEFFAMALLFASNRFGDGPVPYDYSVQAREILKECVHKGENGIGNSMWDAKNRLIKFVPEVSFSDPSYHLPHFYELFALWADSNDRQFWIDAASASREYLKISCHPITGLAPEYAHYDGTPYIGEGHELFYSDSYRVAGNIALDYEWFRGDSWEIEEADKIQRFFTHNKFKNDYRKYTIDGIGLEKKSLHPVGLVATNAMASLATSGDNARSCVDEFWNIPLRTGVRRYYDNCLYIFSLLALSGNYKIWQKTYE
ncbi:xylanase [Clostridium estertheticum]|uniref:glycosyl hydrolase family 8 n=1 Tax=Clostridium estertheticum TaxID=238834 RepID=UPI001CF1A9A5|nr:glycosyl hydrolase family 8 [Clostridium estertheticum]MCB2307055.1 xylanase [Clostridium estertheticum]MCB2345863.1 xylanase [Clostridium estertheticum]MCB2350545.1 xylanase [Clostridium estertheticum]WAG45454.1 xylanase [Clostridium estertheticum]